MADDNGGDEVVASRDVQDCPLCEVRPGNAGNGDDSGLRNPDDDLGKWAAADALTGRLDVRLLPRPDAIVGRARSPSGRDISSAASDGARTNSTKARNSSSGIGSMRSMSTPTGSRLTAMIVPVPEWEVLNSSSPDASWGLPSSTNETSAAGIPR